MGDISEVSPVMLIVPCFSRHRAALEWAQEKCSENWGEIDCTSSLIEFDDTEYYQPSMGSDLKMLLLAFKKLINPAAIKEIKITTNKLEEEYCALARHQEDRPLNLDPGYITPAKFVLATTKDSSHRLYLGDGIYAEVTLYYSQGGWQDHFWTYPNYRRTEYKEFLTICRNKLLKKR